MSKTILSVLPILEITALGTRDFLMHNGELSVDSNPIVKEIKKLTALRKKSDAQKADLSRWSLIGSAYYDEEVGFYVPTWNVEANLAKAGSRVRLKEIVKEAVTVSVSGKPDDDRIPLIFPEGVKVPKKPEDMFKNPVFHDERPVRIKKQSISRDRAKIPAGWSILFHLQYDTDLLNESQILEILKIAGRMGLGDYRPRFGRYKIVSVNRIIEDESETEGNEEEEESND